MVTPALMIVRMVAALPSHHQVSTGCYTGVLGHVYIPDRTAKILEECACSDIRYRWWSPIFLNIHIWQPHFSVCRSPTSYIL